MRDFKPGDTVWWWTDGDPGDAEVGPQPDIYPTSGTFIRTCRHGDLVVCLDEETQETKIVKPQWLLSGSELQEMEAADAQHEGP